MPVVMAAARSAALLGAQFPLCKTRFAWPPSQIAPTVLKFYGDLPISQHFFLGSVLPRRVRETRALRAFTRGRADGLADGGPPGLYRGTLRSTW